MHNIALGITAWILLSVPTGLALGRVLRRRGRRLPAVTDPVAPPAYASAREFEHVAEVLDDGRDRHQPYHRAGVRHTPRDLHRRSRRGVVVEQDRVVEPTRGHEVDRAQAPLVRITDARRARWPSVRGAPRADRVRAPPPSPRLRRPTT